MKYEGEYLDDKKNGEEKEFFDEGELKYEGEYLNDKKNGEGKEYESGTLIFKGEFKNDKRWNGKFESGDYEINIINGISQEKEVKNGKIKKYFENGKIKFEGEYLKGTILNGTGYKKNGDIDFEIKNGNGKIKEYCHNGEGYYEKEYSNGKWDGKLKNISEIVCCMI